MKSLSFFVAGMLLLSSFAALSVGEANEYERLKIGFSNPITMNVIVEGERYVELRMEGANGCLCHPGEPMLPIYIKTFNLLFGTRIINIGCTIGKAKNLVLLDKVIPGPRPVATGVSNYDSIYERNEEVYASDDFYPDSWFDYHTSSGIDENNEHKTFLSIRVHPVRYSPATETISYVKNISLKITFQEPNDNLLAGNGEYELVIIAPSEFSDALQPLVAHKDNFNIDTLLKTTEDIYNEYEGADKPEQIKYFIKDAIDTWSVKYVLLVGGLNSLVHAQRRDDKNQGSNDWLVPVRYSNLKTKYDPGFICDLYYADIYDGEGNFSSWDSNNDGVFASWKSFDQNKDILDLTPDVAVGRLACRNINEVNTMVQKIITYESTPCDFSWFKKMVLVGGDTFDDVSSTNFYEGEVETQKALEYLPDFEPIKIWASNKDSGGLVPESADIVSTVSKGCGFLFFAGHGSAERWNTHWAEGPFEREERAEGLWWFNMPQINNGDKLPVCIVGGCHNSEFNVTALCFLNYWLNKLAKITGLEFLERWPGNVASPVPECWSWFLTRQNNGGSIATIGNSGTGYGKIGNIRDLDGDGIDDPDCIEGYGGYLEILLFKSYGIDQIHTLGDTWRNAVTEYLTTYPGMQDQTDCKTVQQWVLLGDPSLKIGGRI